MRAFTRLKGIVAPLDMANIDTDQIIPKQFLQKVGRQGFGVHLFHDWRYLDPQGNINNPDFVLNRPEYVGASILLSRENFGCGSSREHAPWALEDFGFRVVIAPSFADIFYGNCFNIGLLPITLTAEQIDELFALSQNSVLTLEIDLVEQQLSVAGKCYKFDVDPSRKSMLLAGLDSIGVTLAAEADIDKYELAIPDWRA